MEFQDIDKASAWRLTLVTKTSDMPALARAAAVRLYQIGKKKYATDFLIKQMNQYKLSEAHRNINSEVCPEAAKELGRLGDDRAIEPLFEALGELGFGPAIGLAQHGDPTIEKRLAQLVEGESKVAVFAAVCLGYMKNEAIVPRLIFLFEHHQEYEKAVNDRISRLGRELIHILGAYEANELAEQFFRANVNKSDIDWILCMYLHQNKYPSLRWLEWEIVMKYGWNIYLDTDAKIFAFRHTFLDRWENYSDAPCPFKSEADTEKLRGEIVESIAKRYFQ